MRSCAVVMACVMALPFGARAQSSSLVAMLGRATDYVETLHGRLLDIVSEERYQQRASRRIWSAGGFGRDSYERRTLRSDYLLVQPPGTRRHYGYRDVFEVDGRPVRDREERLVELFLAPTASAERQIRGILNESARHNIGEVERNINTPTLALLVLRSDYKSRFSFTRVDDTSLPLGLDRPADPPPESWVIAYDETWPTTIVSGRRGQNMPARGRFWIEPTRGRVWATEITFDTSGLDAVIAVRYEIDDSVGHAVPVEMRERYRTSEGDRVDGTATYGRFRRFRVDVEEAQPPTR